MEFVVRPVFKRLIAVAIICSSMLVVPAREALAFQRSSLSSNFTYAANGTEYQIGPRHSFTILAGQKKYFTAHVETDHLGSYGPAISVDSGIRCNASGSKASIANTNWVASTGAVVAQNTRLLFTAPTSGTWTCYLFGLSIVSTTTKPTMTVLGSGRTYLDMSDGNHSSGQMWQGSAPAYLYMGPKAGEDNAQYILAGSFQALPALTGRTVTGAADVAITTCYNGTASCPSAHWGSSGSTTIDTRLVMSRMRADGTVCAVTNIPSSGYKRTVISNAIHHLKIDNAGVASNAPATGCTSRFVIKLYVAWIAGNPFELEMVSGPGGVYWQSLAVGLNT
jgi:hypothetical protein